MFDEIKCEIISNDNKLISLIKIYNITLIILNS